jgi:CRISPR-associated endonuclease Csn1
LKDIFGDDWATLNIKHQPNEKRTQKKEDYTTEDIWHVLFSTDDDEFIKSFGLTSLKLDDLQTKKFIGLWFSMPVDYGNLSLKAIQNILPFLRLGLIYTEAALLAKLPEVLGEEIWQRNKQELVDNISQYH